MKRLLWLTFISSFCIGISTAYGKNFPPYPEEKLIGADVMKSLISLCAQSAGYYAGMAKLRNQGLSIDEALARAPSTNPYSTSPSARVPLSQIWGRKRYDHPEEIAADIDNIAVTSFNRCINQNLSIVKPFKPDSF